MNHEIEVSNLMFNKTSNEEIIFKKYDINVDLEEESSNEEKTVLKYSLDLTSNPKNSVINISGNTTLSGEQSEIEEFLKQENEKTPEVVSLIYQELFPLMYIISKNMKIPSPAHTISQNNIEKAIQQTEKQDSINEKPHETQPSENVIEVNETDQTTKGSPEPEINSTESDVKEEQNNENKT
jgi:hypothetical protein